MSTPLRVLYLPPASHQRGQLSRYSFLDEEIRALAARGVHAYVLSAVEPADVDDGTIHIRALPPDTPTERRRTLAFLARSVARVPLANLADVRSSYRSLRIERFAAEVIEREHIKLVHSFFGRPRGFGGLLASRATHVPLVTGLRGSDVNILPTFNYGSRLDRFFDRAFRQLLKGADRTISVSEFVRRQALELGAHSVNAHVVLKGVRLDRFRSLDNPEAARAAVGASSPLILAVSGLVRIKGLNHVLEALAAVKASGRTFTFVVCGEGPERQTLLDHARSLGLAECCSFRGKIPRHEITKYFAAADLLVHGSLIEASGNVLLEAMASGVPVVCTDAGGPAEYVRDGATGFVVPVADAAAMADRISRLLDDATLRETFGRNGRALAEDRFSYDRMIDEILDVYQSILQPDATERLSGKSVDRSKNVHGDAPPVPLPLDLLASGCSDGASQPGISR